MGQPFPMSRPSYEHFIDQLTITENREQWKAADADTRLVIDICKPKLQVSALE